MSKCWCKMSRNLFLSIPPFPLLISLVIVLVNSLKSCSSLSTSCLLTEIMKKKYIRCKIVVQTGTNTQELFGVNTQKYLIWCHLRRDKITYSLLAFFFINIVILFCYICIKVSKNSFDIAIIYDLCLSEKYISGSY